MPQMMKARGGLLAAAFACATMGALPAHAAAPPSRAAAVTAEITGLAAEIDSLEGAGAVKKLQRAFGFYMDRGLWGEAADLFADNGTVEMGMDGVYVGKARIHEYFKRQGGGKEGLSYGQLNERVQLQPVVDVAEGGMSAKGRWRELLMLGHFGKDAAWGDGIYENDYVKEGGVWKIRTMHLYVNFVTPFDGGWARMQASPADWRTDVAKAFPSDRPPSATYRPFPDPQVAPFHYKNPVSGRIWEGKP